jgi:hypothetical protein
VCRPCWEVRCSSEPLHDSHAVGARMSRTRHLRSPLVKCGDTSVPNERVLHWLEIFISTTGKFWALSGKCVSSLLLLLLLLPPPLKARTVASYRAVVSRSLKLYRWSSLVQSIFCCTQERERKRSERVGDQSTVQRIDPAYVRSSRDTDCGRSGDSSPCLRACLLASAGRIGNSFSARGCWLVQIKISSHRTGQADEEEPAGLRGAGGSRPQESPSPIEPSPKSTTAREREEGFSRLFTD